MHRGEPPLTPSNVPSAAWIDLERRLHDQLDLDTLAFVLVNEVRRLIDCDRVSLLLLRRGRWAVAAVSGQDVFDRRSNVVRGIESFLETVAPAKQAFYHDGSPQDLPPQVEAGLAQLLDVTHARRLAAAPLRAATDDGGDADDRPAPTKTIGWLVVEQFTPPESTTTLREQVEQAVRSASPALRNARRLHDLPLRKVGQAIERWTRGRMPSRAVAIVGGLALVVAALCLIPAELKVEARGVLQPRHRRHVFAPAEGVVVDVSVRQGERIVAGQALLSLRRPELDFESTRVEGEILTHEKRLTSVLAARLRGSASGTLEANELARLTAEEVEVKQQLEGLRRQLIELRRQRESLAVASPIAGQVLTWDAERQLAVRPVQKGMLLLTIGDVDGPWELELHIPDEYVGYVRRAQREAGDAPPTVEFISAAAAETTYVGTLRDVAIRSDLDAEGRSTVLATVTLDEGIPRDVLHPATAVAAKIHCGRASLGYVWLVDVIHLVRTRLLF